MVAFSMTDRWKPERDLAAICEFMREPEIYWAVNDRLAPQPEQMDLEGWLCHPSVYHYVASYGEYIIGYVQFIRRTSVGLEMHVAYDKQFRGKPAKTLTLFAMAQAFLEKGALKIWSPIPSDNKAALWAAGHVGMCLEGTLTKAIVREDGLRNLLLYAVTKEQFLKGAH